MRLKPSATMAMTARASSSGARAGTSSRSRSASPLSGLSPRRGGDRRRASKGYTKYTPSNGTADLREAISDWMFKEIGVRWPRAQVIATSGAKQALYNACMALLDEGDEAVIPQSLLGQLPRDGAPRAAKALGPHAPAGRRLVAAGRGLERLLTPRTRCSCSPAHRIPPAPSGARRRCAAWPGCWRSSPGGDPLPTTSTTAGSMAGRRPTSSRSRPS